MPKKNKKNQYEVFVPMHLYTVFLVEANSLKDAVHKYESDPQPTPIYEIACKPGAQKIRVIKRVSK